MQIMGEKFEFKYYYWELVLVVRKICIMTAFTVYGSNEPQKAWFGGTIVVLCFLLLHSAVRCTPLLHLALYASAVAAGIHWPRCSDRCCYSRAPVVGAGHSTTS